MGPDLAYHLSCLVEPRPESPARGKDMSGQLSERSAEQRRAEQRGGRREGARMPVPAPVPGGGSGHTASEPPGWGLRGRDTSEPLEPKG